MGKVAFFDRDGTINVNFGHVYKPEDLEVVEGIPDIIRGYNEAKVPVIVVTNQAGIAKGYYTREQMERFNSYLNAQLNAQFGAHIDAFYVCPHHPDFTGDCDCRKPKPGLFFRAAEDYDVDFSQSVMYGDKESDRLAALAAGITEFHLVTCEKNV